MADSAPQPLRADGILTALSGFANTVGEILHSGSVISCLRDKIADKADQRKQPGQCHQPYKDEQDAVCQHGIDFDYISGLSKQLNMSCIGATNYSQKTIYLSDASATLHEFGHFLDWTLGIPAKHQRLYLAEAQNSGLRDYAKTNAREYFADCFDYWIAYSGSEKRMETFRNAAPQTWAYFEALEKNNWRS